MARADNDDRAKNDKIQPELNKQEAELESLWQSYHKDANRTAYEGLVDAYLPLVKVTVGRMSVNLPTFVSREDLYSAGCMGLISAIERYDPEREAKFTTYAITRIRGSIIDELRSHDTLGRVVRDRVGRIEKAEAELQNNNADINPEAIAQAAGLTMTEYWDAEIGAQAAKKVSLNNSGREGKSSLADLLVSKGNDNPGARIETKELVKVIMTMLTDKEKALVVMYYEEELTLKEIGSVLKVTESRVCQMHGAMIQKIRKKLEQMGIPV